MDDLIRQIVAILVGRPLMILLRRRLDWFDLMRQTILLVLSMAVSVLIGWYLIEEEEARRRSIMARIARREPEIPLPSIGAGDDLTVIDGIGPTYARALKEIGIMSFADLARQDPDELSDRLSGQISATRIRNQDWIGQAKQLTQ